MCTEQQPKTVVFVEFCLFIVVYYYPEYKFFNFTFCVISFVFVRPLALIHEKDMKGLASHARSHGCCHVDVGRLASEVTGFGARLLLSMS
jgi:hypothetical protein